MKFIIWGAGARGERLIRHMGEENVIAYIDSNPDEKKMFCNKPVISLQEYEEKYQDYIVVISYVHESEGVQYFKEKNMDTYLLLTDCPGEFQAPNDSTALKNYVTGLLRQDAKYGIYGCTLFSIYVYDWIQSKCDTKPSLIDRGDIREGIYHILKKNNYQIVNEKDNESKSYDQYLECNFVEPKVLGHRLQQNQKLQYLYDCSDRIKEYFNPEILKLKDRYKGKRGFIVATGPSLKISDLNRLKEKNEICISMNEIWKAFEQTDWRPVAYVKDDHGMMDGEIETINTMNVENVIIGDSCYNFWESNPDKRIIRHHFNHGYSEERYPLFAEDFSRQCYYGATVTYSCIQLAVYMGLNPIYLLGVDFSYAGPDHDQKYKHFFDEKKLAATGYTKQVTLAYQAARQYADEHNIKIINATRDGKLEIFKRNNFDELF